MEGVSPPWVAGGQGTSFCYTSQLSCAEIVKHPPPHTHKIASTERPVFHANEAYEERILVAVYLRLTQRCESTIVK